MSWDQRISNKKLSDRQMSAYFPAGNNYVLHPLDARHQPSGKPGSRVIASVPIRNIDVESQLYTLGYYNPTDCMTLTEYKTYIKGQIESNLRFDENLKKSNVPLTINKAIWNINTSPR